MKRLKSIDIFRGISMMWMFVGHLITWGLNENDIWFYYFIYPIIDVVGASAFLFISGISTSLSYNRRKIDVEINENYTKQMVRNEYLLRVFFIFILAFLFNVVHGWLESGDIINLWRWYMLMTIAFSMLIAWPLLKTSKILRISIGLVIWIGHKILFEYVSPNEGEMSINGIIFFIVYRHLGDDPLIIFFTFFLIGTVYGDIVFKVIQTEDQLEKWRIFKKNLLYPIIFILPILILITIFIEYPSFITKRGSFSWLFYSIGFELIFLTIMMYIEEFRNFKIEKSYRFLFYFSYYSLSIFIVHFVFGLVFRQIFNLITIWFYIFMVIISFGLVLRFLYKRFEGKYNIFGWNLTFSVKVQISRTSKNFVRK